LNAVKPKPNSRQTNQNLKLTHVADAKRGKTRSSEAAMIEHGYGNAKSKAKPMRITIDTQEKIFNVQVSLITHISFFYRLTFVASN